MRLNAILVLFGVMGIAHYFAVTADIFYPFSILYIEVVTTCLGVFCIGYFYGWLSVSATLSVSFVKFLVRFYLGKLRAKRYFEGMFIIFSVLTCLDRYLLFGSSFLLPEIVMQYRVLVTDEGGSNAIRGLALGNFFIFLAPAFLIAFAGLMGRIELFGLLALFMLDVYLSSARSGLFLPALIAFFYWAVPLKISTNLIIKSALLLVLLFTGFVLIGDVVGKGNEELDILVYLAAPIHAFDALLVDSSELKDYWLSFRPLQGNLGPLFGYKPIEIMPNIYTPLPTNVFSIFGVYYLDYGIFGLFIWFFFFGASSSFLEKVYMYTRHDGIRLLVALNLAILSLSVFYDYYTSSGVVWMIVILSSLFFGPSIDLKNDASEERGAACAV